MTIRRIGVLTGGGDCPGLNAVIRAVVKSTILQHGWEVLGIHAGFDGLVTDRDGAVEALGYRSVQGLLHRGGTILGTSLRGNPYRYPVTRDGAVVLEDVSEAVVRRVRALDLDGLVVIGGDGTMNVARRLGEQGLAIVGVPKTIDNDLVGTDVTFGFDTAVNVAVDAIDRLHTTAESHDRAMVLEVMGRDAGWIALYSGVAGGTDAILLPELPYRVELVAEKLERRRARGSRFATIVVAEGARPVGGEASTIVAARPGALPRLGGAGARFARELEGAYDIETRTTVLGHVQRGGSPSPADRTLATRFGVRAVELLAEGRFGHMVALQGTDVVALPIEDVAGQKLVAPYHPLVGTARAIGICLGDDSE